MGKSRANSYFFYMQEQRKKVPAWKDKSNQELMVLCDQGWTNLSPMEKKRFEDMRDEFRNRDPANADSQRRKGEVRVSGGYDHLGNPLADIKRRDLERARKVREKIDAVALLIEKATLAGVLESEHFNIIETNVFVKIDEDKVFVPAEISIAKFSLKEGVIKVYQAFPKAGTIPLGYKRECMQNSITGHKIPLEDMAPPEAEVEDRDKIEFKLRSDEQIFEDIVDHMAGAESVFCMPEKLSQCEGVLRTISNRSSLVMPVTKFLPLPELLFKLGNSSELGQMIPSPGIAERELDSERFLYKSGLSCLWHEVMTETNTCTSATTNRLCYTVLDLCCQHYGIPLVGGKHIPRSVESEPCKEWALPEYKPRVLVRNNNILVKGPGEFASEDVRLRTSDKNEVKIEEVSIREASEKKPNIVNQNMDKYKQDCAKSMLSRGTISDFMGAVTESASNLSMQSDSSTEADFITMDSISEAGSAKIRGHAPVVIKGHGRGAVLPGRKSRLAASFPGVKKTADQGAEK